MNKYKNQPFFKLALRFTIIFLVLVSIMEIIFSIIKHGSFSGMVTQYFSPETWFYFVKRILVMSGFYGLFMAGYYKYIKK